MERAPLRPVPRRPEGPVDPDRAIGHVGELLPVLDEGARRALALVELAGLPRDGVGLEPSDAGLALARGRKALRRSLYPLPGSGWCERAELLISDRMDGELEPRGAGRLDVHLANCGRCVEHELRLAQSIDALVAGFLEAHPEPAPEVEPEPDELPAPPAPELRVVEPDEAVPAAPVAAPPGEEPAAWSGGALAWKALYLLSVLLAVAAVILTALGVAGVDPF